MVTETRNPLILAFIVAVHNSAVQIAPFPELVKETLRISMRNKNNIALGHEPDIFERGLLLKEAFHGYDQITRGPELVDLFGPVEIRVRKRKPFFEKEHVICNARSFKQVMIFGQGQLCSALQQGGSEVVTKRVHIRKILKQSLPCHDLELYYTLSESDFPYVGSRIFFQ